MLVAAAVSGVTYGAYSYFMPKYVAAQKEKEEKELAQKLQEEQQKAAEDEDAQNKESENMYADAGNLADDNGGVDAGTSKNHTADAEVSNQSDKTGAETSDEGELTGAENAAEQQAVAINEAFQIDSSAVEDYEAALDPNTYLYYDSDISDFAFFYPSELFNQVTYHEKPTQKAYGMNMQTLDFTASKGSELKFTLCRRTDYLSLEQMTNHIYEQEMESLQDASKLVLSVEEDYGRVIVTGYTKKRDKLVYDMVKIEPTYVMHMKLYFPQYTGAEDQLQKGYVTECVYRMCAFSGSSKSPRSYQEYKEG